ncbi:MAG TPA: hypothetical protein VER11_04865 [Polyangiaceae bacterium]|nr:hypothetical protein [Polyangiaceae bacterium]
MTQTLVTVVRLRKPGIYRFTGTTVAARNGNYGLFRTQFEIGIGTEGAFESTREPRALAQFFAASAC